jgi:signal transduction histidine kinase
VEPVDAKRISNRADEYRAKLARTLHETTQQQLVDILLHLRRIEQVRLQETNEPWVDLEAAVAETLTAIEQLRVIVSEICPAVLATGGLESALEALALRLPFPLELDIDPTSLAMELARTTYFFCAEFLGILVSGGTTVSAKITTVANTDSLTIHIHHSGDRSAGAVDLGPIEERVLAVGGRLFAPSTAIELSPIVAEIPLFP